MLCPARLEPDLVILRWLNIDHVCAGEWRSLAALLDAQERARAARFAFAADREAYVAAHALTRRALACFASASPMALRFAADDYGKPSLVDPPSARQLQFSLSHTRGLVGVGIAMARDVGVDVERIAEDRIGIELAERILPAAEVAYLRRQPEAARAGATMVVWTLKEAYVKAIGKGLSYPLDAFVVLPDAPELRDDARSADDASTWLLHSQRIEPQFVMGLAARRRRDETLRIDARETTAAEILS